MPPVLYEKKGRIAYITLNRPKALNAMTLEGWAMLGDCWKKVRDDNDVFAAIITGADTGSDRKSFCAGMDLKEIGGGSGDKGKAPSMDDVMDFFKGIECWKPFIAAIDGIATGGGLELAMLCDLRIITDKARLGLREVRQGLMPGGGGTQRLPRIVPFCLALEIPMTADSIDPDEAYRIGLVNKVVPQSELMNAANDLANIICKNGPLAVKAVKEAAYRGVEVPLKKGMEIEQELFAKIMASKDAMEGMMAFAMKKEPQFKGE